MGRRVRPRLTTATRTGILYFLRERKGPKARLTLPTVLSAFVAVRERHPLRPPATEEKIRTAEDKIGGRLPPQLRHLYTFTSRGWTEDLGFLPLGKAPDGIAWEVLTRGSEEFVEEGYGIPEEVRMFASERGSYKYGMWLPDSTSAVYNNPTLELTRELVCERVWMTIVGTNLTSFPLARCACYINEGSSRVPDQKRVRQDALDVLDVPRVLRSKIVWASFRQPLAEWIPDGDARMEALRAWTDPLLPAPRGDAFDHIFSIADLRRVLG